MHIHLIKKYYFINKFDTNNIDKQDRQTAIIFRNYSSKRENENLIVKIKNYCKKKSLKFYLSNNIKLAVKLNLDGAYIPAFNKSFMHNSYSLKKNFKFLGSAHNLKQIRHKEKQKVGNIFLSPIFLTKNYKSKLGIYKLLNLKKNTKTEITCLGGINYKNINIIKMINIRNIAGITLFEN